MNARSLHNFFAIRCCSRAQWEIRALAEEMYRLSLRDEMEIELAGLCTDICVVSNALLLRAKLPGTVIKVDPSCCAGVTKESHKAALKTMKMCQIDVMEDALREQ